MTIFFATLYGGRRQKPMRLTASQVREFVRHQRPKDRCVMLASLGGCVSVGDRTAAGRLHFDCELVGSSAAASLDEAEVNSIGDKGASDGGGDGDEGGDSGC